MTSLKPFANTNGVSETPAYNTDGNEKLYRFSLAKVLFGIAVAALLAQCVNLYLQALTPKRQPISNEVVREARRGLEQIGVPNVVQVENSGNYTIQYVRYFNETTKSQEFLLFELRDSIGRALRKKFGEEFVSFQSDFPRVVFRVENNEALWTLELIAAEEEQHETFASGRFDIVQKNSD